MNISFKGKLADNSVQQIRLSTNNGLTGYQIVKAAVLPTTPPTSNASFVLQIFSTENDATGSPRSASSTIDFDDPTLLGIALYNTATASNDIFEMSEIIDNKKINQDIYVTVVDGIGNESANYYIELEKVKLSKDEATVATLKDMRAGPDTNFGL